MLIADVVKAMLGDLEAQKRLTEKGELLPCPWCGKSVSRVGTIAELDLMDEDSPGYDWCATHYEAVCDFNAGGCGCHTGPNKTAEEAACTWNTRAPILSAVELEGLE